MPTTASLVKLPRILVAGDVVTDHCIYEGQRRRSGSPMRLGTRSEPTPGGAALLADLLESVVKEPNRIAVVIRGFAPGDAATTANGYCVFRPFPGGRDKVWRVAETLGFDGGKDVQPEGSERAYELRAEHQVVVLDDGGGAFRRWPSSHAWPQFLLESVRELPRWLVIKMSHPFAAGDLWHTIKSGKKPVDATPALTNEVRDPATLLARTVAVLSIHDLRVETVTVSRNLSWERTALDLLHELSTNPDLEGLRALRYVIVSVESDAALLVEFEKCGLKRARLVFDPAGQEGAFREPFKGSAYGFQTCLAAAVAARLAVPYRKSDRGALELSGNAEPTDWTPYLEQGIIEGLAGMRQLLEQGHGEVNSGTPGFPISAVAAVIAKAPKDVFGVEEIPVGLTRSDNWSIIAAKPEIPLFGLARRVALYGERELQRTPYVKLGKLFSVERTEIESLRSLERLLKDYDADQQTKKPLNIAVFGPPGSGKSFGVKELSKAIFGSEVPLLEFNLSQFQDASELHGLYHQIRDEGLRGKLPVVFWDEFDSRNLTWLQYLLAPMQDGTFQAGQITHPIGKCVFVFAGGTRHRLEEFGKPIGLSDEELQRAAWEPDFVAKKGPDFLSRLSEYLNVLGPNPRDHTDVTYPVRRALLVRAHLGAKPRDPVKIDRGLLTALLAIDKYRHGSRSLEKITAQLRVSRGDREACTRSDLPPRSQLNLHVDADAFLALMEAR